jgi:hypothetical protein
MFAPAFRHRACPAMRANGPGTCQFGGSQGIRGSGQLSTADHDAMVTRDLRFQRRTRRDRVASSCARATRSGRTRCRGPASMRAFDQAQCFAAGLPAFVLGARANRSRGAPVIDVATRSTSANDRADLQRGKVGGRLARGSPPLCDSDVATDRGTNQVGVPSRQTIRGACSARLSRSGTTPRPTRLVGTARTSGGLPHWRLNGRQMVEPRVASAMLSHGS